MDVIEVLSSAWAQRALIAGSLVGISCGVLGCFIVLRNMSLIGDALSHSILPGVVVAYVLVGQNLLGVFIGSLVAGLITVVMMTWLQQNVKTKNDAVIGIVFTAMFSIGVMGISYLSHTPGFHLDLKDFLFGNILGINDSDLQLTVIISVIVILSLIALFRPLFITTFQPTIAFTLGIPVKWIHYALMILLSIVVVSALQTVGVILVVAMLITPASTALLLSTQLKNVVILAGLIGLLSAILGLILSIFLQTTPGPAMAVVATMFYFLAVFFAPGTGLINQWRRQRAEKTKIDLEDILKEAFKLSHSKSLTLEVLSSKLNIAPNRLKQLLRHLQASKLISLSPQLELSQTGSLKAQSLVRAHRLWETYLVDQIGLTEDQIHDEAEHQEHHSPAELIDEIDASLGYPSKDPHGSPIPPKQN
jgi:ABC-type Mn2+/Zn2+ transport system permease subunit/Mn-dependent DtxR family transcriptional regulator